MKSILTSIPLFSRLTEEHLLLLSAQVQHHTFPRNNIIFSEGDQSDSLYIVNSGRIRIFISDSDGKEMQLKILEPGDYFGELSLIDRQARSASAIAVTKCQLSTITSTSLLFCLKDNHEMAYILLQGLTKRLRDATDLQRQLALMDVYGRLRVNLLALAKVDNGLLKLEPKPTQQEIASKIGASREAVSRIISDLKTQEYISIEKYSITILKELPEKL